MVPIIETIIGGIIVGVISKYLPFGLLLYVFPWMLIALALGWLAKTKKMSLIQGGIFGFVLFLTYSVVGYEGLEPIITVMPYFLLGSLISGICGIGLGITGFFCRKLFRETL